MQKHIDWTDMARVSHNLHVGLESLLEKMKDKDLSVANATANTFFDGEFVCVAKDFIAIAAPLKKRIIKMTRPLGVPTYEELAMMLIYIMVRQMHFITSKQFKDPLTYSFCCKKKMAFVESCCSNARRLSVNIGLTLKYREQKVLE